MATRPVNRPLRIPGVIATLQCIGLAGALLGDGMVDVASGLLIGAPLAVTTIFLVISRRGTPQ